MHISSTILFVGTWKHQVVYIQRSCGYEMRPTLSMDQIKKAVDFVKRLKPEIPVLVDNCYGEFTEDKEPTHIGADLIMGSLIKNPGGTIVSTGGYSYLFYFSKNGIYVLLIG